MTKTSICRLLNVFIAAKRSPTACCPSTRESINSILKPNLPILFKKSLITAPCLALITPMRLGQKGIGRFLAAANKPSASSF